jgi:hypothetical protein
MQLITPSFDTWSECTQRAQLASLPNVRLAARWCKEAAREARSHPVPTLLGICLGWVVLIGFFRFFGDVLSDSSAYWLFGWTVEQGYGTGDFRPFYACASVVSVMGFVLSGFCTTRASRAVARASLLGFVISLETAVMASVGALTVIARPTSVPHTWFYAIWLGLPTARHVGFGLIPLFAALGGWLNRRAEPSPASPDDGMLISHP